MDKLTNILSLATSRRFLISVGATALVFFAKDIFKVELTHEEAVQYMDKFMVALTVIAGTFNISMGTREHK